jgi:protein-S-isoprenylcysteine O-methyltransferase Ste14
MTARFLVISAAAVLLAVPFVILLASEQWERRNRRRFDAAYKANLRRRRPDLKL